MATLNRPAMMLRRMWPLSIAENFTQFKTVLNFFSLEKCLGEIK